MQYAPVRSALAAAIAGLACSITSTASADVTGFNDLDGWTYNQAPFDTGTPASLPDPDTIHLTNLGTTQSRNIFYNTPQDITRFTASFTYQALNASTFGCDYGAAFTIQGNSPDVFGDTGGGLGYTGIDNSAAITLQLTRNASGFWKDGVSGSSTPLDPMFLRSGNPIQVSLEYNGTFLKETLLDTVTQQEFSQNLVIGDLSGIVGSDTAYIGFTGSTTTGACSGNAADQYFSDFQFTTVPAPGTAGVLALAGIGAAIRRRR